MILLTAQNELDRRTRQTWRRFVPVLLCAVLTGCMLSTRPAGKSNDDHRGAPGIDRGIAVLVTDGSAAFAGVAEEIRKRYGHNVETYLVGGRGEWAPQERRRLESASAPIVVAIGLPAAQAAKGLRNRKVIFCQVFNHQDARLVSPAMKGVSMIPPAREQLRAWKSLSPGLTKVGLITGSHLGWLVDDATAAAKEHGMELIHVEVGSDKETLYAYKRLGRRIQGLWLVPDNRVLSRDVLRDMMVHSMKEGMQVLAFSRELLAVGALLSAESQQGDIAEQVIARVKQAQESGGLPGPDLRPLTRQELRINAVMAQRLKLRIPKELSGFAYTPS